MKYKKNKRYSSLALSALLLTIGLSIFIFYKYHNNVLVETAQEITHENKKKGKKYRLQIEGVRLINFNKNGEKTLFLTADTFTIKKKKLGFFRLGMVYNGVLENGVIDIHSGWKKFHNSPDYPKEKLPSATGKTPSFPLKRIASIIIKPVCISLRGEHSLLSQVTAHSAIIALPPKKILFQGNVRVVSGEKTLRTEELSFFTEKFILQGKHHFSLVSPDEQREGKNITVDLFLHTASTVKAKSGKQ